MSPQVQVLLSGSLTFGVPLALAIRELVVVRRPRTGWGWGDPPPPAPPPKPSLPPCLLVPPRTRLPEGPVRALERV